MENFIKIEEKMAKFGATPAAIAAFKKNYEQLVAGATGLVPESEISAVASLPRLEELPPAPELEKDVKALLSQAAVLKLNGGLGTSMGLEKAKSLLVVKDGKTFLDLIALQIKHLRAKYQAQVAFTLMNSFSTSNDTKEFLSKEHGDLLKEPLVEMMQNSSPKIDAKTMLPVEYAAHPDMEWCPPGHGDIYPALVGSGFLKKLLDSGVKYLFVSNSDNLGATLDLQLLQFFAQSGKAFLMEVCERTAADKKGGHLCARKSDGVLLLRESAMCPDADKAHFEDIALHKYFNSNNLWLNLEELHSKLEASGGALDLPLIKNKKTVNPRDSATATVFQLETAMGSAIQCFANSGAIVVPRTRFAPVKTCSDLLLLRSDAYKIEEDATIAAAVPNVPLVKLDDGFYKLVDQLEALVPSPPSLKAAASLTVKGPVKFAPGVVVKGDATFEAPGKEPQALAPGEYTGLVKVGAPAAVPA